MSSKLSDNVKILVELVHYLSYGNEKEMGFTLKEVLSFLETPIKHKNGKNTLDCIKAEGLAFLNELKTYMNEMENY